jgi:D-alanyl-D-alanine dipeptidase
MRPDLRPLVAALALLPLAAAGARAAPRDLPSGFVYLRDVAPAIAQDMRYATPNNFTGRPLPGYEAGECILRREVAEALARVAADLARAHDPENREPVSGKDHAPANNGKLGLKVYDCYRPTRAVAAFWRWAHDPRAGGDKRFYPNVPKAELFARGYIAARSRHSEGRAVDLTLVPLGPRQPSTVRSRDGGNPDPRMQTLQTGPASPPAPGRAERKERAAPCTAPAAARAPDNSPDNSLDMGTGFDCLDVASHTASRAVTPAQRRNRRTLKAAMSAHGFSNYFREWWHYEFRAAPRRAYDFPILPAPH